MKKFSSLLLAILSVFIFAGCTKSVVFEDKVIFPNANWTFEDRIVTIKAPIKGSEKPYAIILELELTGIQNVDRFDAVFTLITPKGGKTMKGFVVNFNFPQEPYIIKNSNEKIYRLTIYPKKYFPETGDYIFEVNQLSHKADNYGIHALNLRIEKTKE